MRKVLLFLSHVVFLVLDFFSFWLISCLFLGCAVFALLCSVFGVVFASARCLLAWFGVGVTSFSLIFRFFLILVVFNNESNE